MAAGTTPIFSQTPVFSSVVLSGSIASAKSDGTGAIGTNIFLVGTTGTNGTFYSRVRIHAFATTPTTTTATVIRFFLSTQSSGVTTADDTRLIQEVAIGALSAANATAALMPIDVPLNIAVPSGFSLLVSTHANCATNTGFFVSAFAGDY